GLLGRGGLLALALAATDLALLARHVAIGIEVVEILAVIHLDAGGGDLLRLALGLAGLLPGRGPDVATLDVVHQVVVALDSSLEDLLTHKFQTLPRGSGVECTVSEGSDKLC